MRNALILGNALDFTMGYIQYGYNMNPYVAQTSRNCGVAGKVGKGPFAHPKSKSLCTRYY